MVTEEEIDGVPVFWADVKGPLRAGLTFRAGLVDERFVQAGWTHAIEHLALSPLGVRPHAYNGSVDLTTTRFVTSGSAQDVVTTLNTVCASLRDLPTERLEAERSIVAAEGCSRYPGEVEELLTQRFGIDGYGAGYRSEAGVPDVTGWELVAYARERFTRSACAAWFSGPPPPGLDLRLPYGPATPLPEPRPLLPPGPHHVLLGEGSSAFVSLLVRGREEVAVAAQVLYTRTMARLRHADAVSYSPNTLLHRLRGDLVHLVLYADSTEENSAAAARGLLDVLREVAEGAVTEEEVAAALPAGDGDERLLDRVASLAAARVLGDEPSAPVAVTPGRVAEVVTRALDDVLVGVATEADVPPGAGPLVPVHSSGPPEGTVEYAADDDPRGRRLVVTDRGIGSRVDVGTYITIPWDRVSGVLAWDDGTRAVVRDDALTIHVFPDLPDAATLAGLIDRYATPARVARQGVRREAPPSPYAPEDDTETAARIAGYERDWRDRHTELRRQRDKAGREVIGAAAKLVAALSALLVAFSLVFWGIAKLLGAGVLRFAVPAVVGALVVGYWENRKEKRGR